MGKSSGGGSSSQTVTQKSDPWSGVQPYLNTGLAGVNSYFTNPANADPQQISSLQSQLSALQNQSDNWSGSNGGGGEFEGTGYPTSNGPGSTATNPYTSQIQALQSQLSAAQGSGGNQVNLNALPQYYPGQTVASQSPYTLQAIQQLAQQANSPQTQALTNAANQQVTDTLNGNYLDPTQNPGFQQALTDTQKAYSTGTAAQTDAAFNNANAYGGSAYDETKQMQNKAYADSLNTIAGNLYQQGRTNQLQAAGLAPQTSNIQYTNTGQLANAGQAQDAYNQSQINSDISKYNYNSNLPLTTLQDYLGLLNGNYGGTSTTSTPYQSNSLYSGLGAGIGALSAIPSLSNLGSSLGLWGSAAGAAGAAGSAGGLSAILSSAGDLGALALA